MDENKSELVSTTYVAGAHLGQVARGIFGLVQTADALQRSVLARCEPTDAGVAESLARLTRSDPATIESFAFARSDGPTAIVVVRGLGRADVTLPDGSCVVVRHREDDPVTSVEFGFDDVVALTLHITDSDQSATALRAETDGAESLTVVSGMVPCASLTRRDHRHRHVSTGTVEVTEAETRTIVRPGDDGVTETLILDDRAPAKVLAIPCPVGHLNPLHAMQCRVCAAPVATTMPMLVERGALGVLAFSDGTRVVLDENLVIGRDPFTDDDRRRPVAFELEGKGLSRTHAWITLEAWQILLEDRQSTNGTEVTLPGQTPRRIRPGEPTVLAVGTRVSFGGAIWCVVEAA